MCGSSATAPSAYTPLISKPVSLYPRRARCPDVDPGRCGPEQMWTRSRCGASSRCGAAADVEPRADVEPQQMWSRSRCGAAADVEPLQMWTASCVDVDRVEGRCGPYLGRMWWIRARAGVQSVRCTRRHARGNQCRFFFLFYSARAQRTRLCDLDPRLLACLILKHLIRRGYSMRKFN